MSHANATDFLNQSCSILKGAGPKIIEKLVRLELFNFRDLLFHFPLHYQDKTHVVSIQDLRQGNHAVVEGIISDIKVIKRKKTMLVLSISDGTGSLSIRFFYFQAHQIHSFVKGIRLRCFGEVRYGQSGLEMVHPEYKLLKSDAVIEIQETLTPVYPTTEGLSQTVLRQLISQVLAQVNEQTFAEYIPEMLRQKFKLPSIVNAISYIHAPPPDASCEQLENRKHIAQQRIIFEELLAHQLSLRKIRLQNQAECAPEFKKTFQKKAEFLQNLGFELTLAQKRVFQDIMHDLAKPIPMMRLVQGDVGSGKTVVAALSLLYVIEHDYQAVLMAPTDLLAEQHYRNIEKWLTPLGYSVAWLAGKHKGKRRQEILADIKTGQAAVIVGTHALFQEKVEFKQLGLIVIDEQHRFGVEQRLALREKGREQHRVPHQLVMTATPIPRTLAMTYYADLDLSIIDELPKGRTPVKTAVISNERRQEVIERIRVVCQQNRQAYWVCTLIDESEVLASQAAIHIAQELSQQLSEFRIGLVHGRLKAQEKEEIMQAFKNHQLDLLVATTVIEVGVDVPNASLMIIENAERLGLSQLHQLRGRVGRGSTESYCVLLYQPPLSETAYQRLQIMRTTHDGFEISKHDLAIRGPGEVLGTRQTGAMRFHLADLQRDQALLPSVQTLADLLLLDFYSESEAIIQRWLSEGENLAKV